MKSPIIYLMAGLMMTMTACSNDETASEPTEVPIQLAAGIRGLSTRAAQDIQGTMFDKDEVVNVYIKEIVPPAGEPGGSYSNNAYRYRVVDNEGALRPVSLSSPYYPLNTNKVAITAIYPQTVTNSDVQAFSVREDQSTKPDYKLCDLMFSNNLDEQERVATPVTMIFRHMLCKINVNLSVYNASDAQLEGASVKLQNVKKTITFNGETGELTNARDNVTLLTMTNNGRYASSAIIVPQTLEAQEFIRIEMATSNDKMSYVLPQRVKFESGKEYTFSIQVRQDGILVGDYEIQNWDDTPGAENPILQFQN